MKQLRLLMLLVMGLCVAHEAPTLREKSKIVFSPHNFSSAIPVDSRDSTVQDYALCRQCHTPSQLNPVEALWYRQLTAREFTVDTLLSATGGKLLPGDEASRTCLACHDGSVARGFPHRQGPISGSDMNNPARLNRQLHTFLFSDMNRETRPPDEVSPLKLDTTGAISCATCHDPHNNERGNFLRMDTEYICSECHDMANWNLSSHSHPAESRFVGMDPVNCTHCHDIHAVPAGPHLLKSDENTLCMSCHDGRQDAPTEIAAVGNLQTVFEKLFVHPVYRTGFSNAVGQGTGWERFDPAADRLVTCSDCHNPHAVSDQSGRPFLDGSQLFVSGVDQYGFDKKVSDYEYETCYKCHGTNQNVLPGQAVGRLLSRTNMSFHPVEAPGNNPYVPSLKSEWSEQSMLRCSDCHGNDDPLEPAGPHGSDIPHILKASYADYPFAGPDENRLCFRCHDEQRVEQSNGFKFHQLHIQDAGYACSACHNPHGSVEYPGLLDLNQPFIVPLNGILTVTQTEPGHGSCTLKCHDKAHPGQTY